MIEERISIGGLERHGLDGRTQTQSSIDRLGRLGLVGGTKKRDFIGGRPASADKRLERRRKETQIDLKARATETIPVLASRLGIELLRMLLRGSDRFVWTVGCHG